MAKLKAKQRNALPSSDFAGPDRSFPIPDASHAEQALRERKFAPDPDEIAQKVKSKFPQVGASMGPRGPQGPRMPGPRMPSTRPSGIRGTSAFKGLMNTLKTRGV